MPHLSRGYAERIGFGVTHEAERVTHLFHERCLRLWERSACPVCRVEFRWVASESLYQLFNRTGHLIGYYGGICRDRAIIGCQKLGRYGSFAPDDLPGLYMAELRRIGVRP